ncbi:MerR family DNA-binding transcriptional regulator [Paenibacillus apis]|uniref:MerR family DNA-binding transcriptional regulator n=1 Tax=Paenibacillus apis TaxID=1792174 RepID=UPI0035B530A4
MVKSWCDWISGVCKGEGEKLLKIGDFSALSKISIYRLRHYDEIGLLITGGRA